MNAMIQEDKVVAQSEWSEQFLFEKMEKLPIFLDWKKKTVGIMSQPGEYTGYLESSGRILIKKVENGYRLISVFDESATYYWRSTFDIPTLSAAKKMGELILKLMNGHKIASPRIDATAFNRMCEINRTYRNCQFREFFQQMVNIAFME